MNGVVGVIHRLNLLVDLAVLELIVLTYLDPWRFLLHTGFFVSEKVKIISFN